MGHIIQEGRLGPVCPFRLCQRVLQGTLLLLLGTNRVVNNGKAQNDMSETRIILHSGNAELGIELFSVSDDPIKMGKDLIRFEDLTQERGVGKR